MGIFDDLQGTLATRRLKGPDGQLFVRFSGLGKNVEQQNYLDAVMARWPASAPDDGVGYLAEDRRIEQAPIESAAQFKARVATAHDLHYWDGTKTGIKNIFAPYAAAGSTTVDAMVTVFDEWEFVGALGYWWSRFWIVLHGYFIADLTWGDAGAYDDGGTWDTNATVKDLAYIRREIRRVKAPAAMPFLVAVITTYGVDGIWANSGTYDDGGVWSNSTTVVGNLWPIARAWDDGHTFGGSDGTWDDGAVYEDFVAP